MVHWNSTSHSAASEAQRRDEDRRRLRPDLTLGGRSRRRLQLVLAVLGGLLLVALVALLGSSSGTISEARPFDAPEATSAGVNVRWVGRACEQVDPQRTSVVETGTAVEVTLHISVPAGGCAGPATSRSYEVALDAPLGDRELVDGACGLLAFRADERC
jgi:hypothetical protein